MVDFLSYFLDTFLSLLQALFTNDYTKAALISMFVAQFFKLFTHLIKEKELDFKRFTETGGMPSSHTSTVVALTALIGLREGFDSVYFAISAIFSGVTMHDATGIRQAAGKQAELLNKIVDDLFHVRGVKESHLKELLGHTYAEVFGGFTLGIAIACLLN